MDRFATPDVVGCDAGVLACLFESWGGTAVTWLLILFVMVILGVIPWALAYVEYRRDRPRTSQRKPPYARVIAGPALRDGAWIRLLELGPGLRRIEVYGPDGWVLAHRNVSEFFAATRRPSPGRPRSGPARVGPPS
jgi:hypothetical protein